MMSSLSLSLCPLMTSSLTGAGCHSLVNGYSAHVCRMHLQRDIEYMDSMLGLHMVRPTKVLQALQMCMLLLMCCYIVLCML